MKEDGQIRLVYKDWPILTKASVYGARMALAAKYQGKYDAVHSALMAIPGPKIPEERMLDAIQRSGVDMPLLETDLKNHADEIDAMLKKHLAQAELVGSAWYAGLYRGSISGRVGPDLRPVQASCGRRAEAGCQEVRMAARVFVCRSASRCSKFDLTRPIRGKTMLE